MIETGLRIGDACTLEFNPIVDDSAGGPCLRFHNLKVRADQLIPLSAKAADAMRAQQDHDRSEHPPKSSRERRSGATQRVVDGARARGGSLPSTGFISSPQYSGSWRWNLAAQSARPAKR